MHSYITRGSESNRGAKKKDHHAYGETDEFEQGELEKTSLNMRNTRFENIRGRQRDVIKNEITVGREGLRI